MLNKPWRASRSSNAPADTGQGSCCRTTERSGGRFVLMEFWRFIEFRRHDKNQGRCLDPNGFCMRQFSSKLGTKVTTECWQFAKIGLDVVQPLGAQTECNGSSLATMRPDTCASLRCTLPGSIHISNTFRPPTLDCNAMQPGNYELLPCVFGGRFG